MIYPFPSKTMRESILLQRQNLAKRTILFCIAVTMTLTANTLHHLERIGGVLDNILESAIPEVISGNSRQTLNEKPENGCFAHPPMKVEFDHVENPDPSLEVLRMPRPAVCGSLRRDWSRMPVQSGLARELKAHQTNCSLPLITFHMDNNYGLGSHLVLHSQALCNAIELGYRVRTYNPEWLWMDKMYCDPKVATLSPLLCYFPDAEFKCAKDQDDVLHVNRTMTDPRNRRTFCRRLTATENENYNNQTLPDFRAASMEYLFQSLSPVVIKEAERQVGLLFGERAPADLLVVHIRWGDKFWEMDLVPIDEYIAAVNDVLENRKRNHNSTVNIYLACEDPNAVKAFLEAAPETWKVFVDRTFVELTPYRPAKGNRASWVARNTKGRAGLVALGSLLVAMEADNFVLTTSSNWSRLMDALRRNVIDPRCGNCTTMIDLRPGNW